MIPTTRSARRSLALALLAVVAACATGPGVQRYRLAGSGTHWDVAGTARVFDDVRPKYPEFFEVVLDPARAAEPNIQKLRRDLEHEPADRRNYDALNALAIAYFEYNYRAEAIRGEGFGYLALSFQSAKLLAIPWRAYSLHPEPQVRNAILDFFEDAGSGEKLGTAATAPRVIEIVASLEPKERDPVRQARIRSIAAGIRARVEPGPSGSSDPPGAASTPP